MTSCHLISDRDLTLLRKIDSYYFIYSCGKLVALLVREDLNVYDDSCLTVRNSQGGISYLSCLFTEDRAKEALLAGKLGLSLRRDLSYENIARTNLSSLLYDTLGVKILKRILTDVRACIPRYEETCKRRLLQAFH